MRRWLQGWVTLLRHLHCMLLVNKMRLGRPRRCWVTLPSPWVCMNLLASSLRWRRVTWPYSMLNW